MTDALDLLRDEADARSQALPLPDAAQLWRSGTRRRRRAQLLSGGAVLVVLAALVGTVLVLPGRGDVAVVVPATPSPIPAAAALEDAVQRTVPTWVVGEVEELPLEGRDGEALGPWEAPGRTATSDGLVAGLQLPVEEGGAALSLDWLRMDPPVTAAEVETAGRGRESGPLAAPSSRGPVTTQAWSTADGLTSVFGWSESGGVAVLTGGGGTVDPAALASRGAALLTDLLGGPRTAPQPAPSAPPAPPGTVAEPRFLVDLRAFARDPSPAALAAVPLAPTVALWLGTTTSVERDAAALADPAQWAVPLPDGLYAGYTEVPTALELLARERVGDVVVGPHPHCAGPPRPGPPGLEDAGRVSVQAAEPASCLDWWTVDLFVRGGQVVAVAVDVWEP